MALEMDNRFSGGRRIDEVELWDGKVLDLFGPAKIIFDDDGLGRFQFVSIVFLSATTIQTVMGCPWSTAQRQSPTFKKSNVG